MADSTNTTKKKGGIPGFAVILLIAGAFLVGMFWNRMQSLEQQVADLKGGTGQAAQPVNNNQAAGAGQPNNLPPSQPQLGSAGDVKPVGPEDHVLGNPDASIVLIEYSDYECPFCGRFHPTMKQVVEEYGDQVAWVYRHYPLSQIHPNAQKAAEAAECVAELGGNDAFWEYTDSLFAGGGLTPDVLTSKASELGVNESSFTSCLDSGKYADKVNNDLISGQNAGVSGTPGTVILAEDGSTKLIPGALPYTEVKKAIDSML